MSVHSFVMINDCFERLKVSVSDGRIGVANGWLSVTNGLLGAASDEALTDQSKKHRLFSSQKAVDSKRSVRLINPSLTC